MGNAAIFPCPSAMVDSWWMPFQEAGYTVEHGPEEVVKEDTALKCGGLVSRKGVTAKISIQGDQYISGPGCSFIRIDLIPYPPASQTSERQLSALVKSISRVLVVSGAKCLGAPFGFKTIMTCGKSLENDPASYLRLANTTIQFDDDDCQHLIIWRGKTKVDVFVGHGLDYLTRAHQSFVAVDYNLPMLRAKSRNLLVGDIITLLESAGCQRLNGVIPFPSNWTDKNNAQS